MILSFPSPSILFPCLFVLPSFSRLWPFGSSRNFTMQNAIPVCRASFHRSFFYFFFFFFSRSIPLAFLFYFFFLPRVFCSSSSPSFYFYLTLLPVFVVYPRTPLFPSRRAVHPQLVPAETFHRPRPSSSYHLSLFFSQLSSGLFFFLPPSSFFFPPSPKLSSRD